MEFKLKRKFLMSVVFTNDVNYLPNNNYLLNDIHHLAPNIVNYDSELCGVGITGLNRVVPKKPLPATLIFNTCLSQNLASPLNDEEYFQVDILQENPVGTFSIVGSYKPVENNISYIKDSGLLAVFKLSISITTEFYWSGDLYLRFTNRSGSALSFLNNSAVNKSSLVVLY